MIGCPVGWRFFRQLDRKYAGIPAILYQAPHIAAR
jgi:hypothetical protein